LEKYLTLDLQALIRSLIIIIFTIAITQIVQAAKRHLHARLIQRDMDASRRGRIATSISVSATTLNGILVIGGLISLLTTLGIDMTPILASLGIVGLGFSLGAQALIKDFLAGLTILTENQFAIGDEIKIGAVRGTVEEISMRATRVREYNGLLHIFPNSEARLVANASRDWMRAIVDINLPYSADLRQAVSILQEAVEPWLLDTPEVAGWNSLSDWAVQIRLTAKTLPGKQYTVQSALRRCAIEALTQAGIAIALPLTQPGDSPAA
jgi:small conductance mechanosensitive channel